MNILHVPSYIFFNHNELHKLVHYRKISVVCCTFLGIKMWDCSENCEFEKTSLNEIKLL